MGMALGRATGVAAALVVGSLSGCSLLGLDHFRAPTCAEPERACDALNARDGIDPSTACLVWQCAEASAQAYCHFGPRDQDRDGHSALACAGQANGGSADDCDDSSASVRPGASDVCNGADDDCDGLVDGALGEPEAAAPLLATGGTDPAWAAATELGAGAFALTYGTDGRAWLERLPRPGVDPSVAGEAITLLAPNDPRFAGTAAESADAWELGCIGAVVERGIDPSIACAADDACGPGEQCFTAQASTESPPPRFCDVAVMPAPIPSPTHCRADVECDDGLYCTASLACEPREAGNETHDARGCRLSGFSPCPRGRCDEANDACVTDQRVGCSPASLVVAHADADTWLAAHVVSTAGCDVLRVGSLSDGSVSDVPDSLAVDHGVTQRGGVFRTTIYGGVDLPGDVAARACTGAHRALEAPRGASIPAIAALPASGDARPRPQGLVAFRGGPVTGTAGVEVLGVWHEETDVGGGTRLGWVSGAANGVPISVDAALPANVGPSVVSYDGAASGYVLAYPAEGGGVALHAIDVLPAPAPDCGVVGVTPPCLTTVPGTRLHITRFTGVDVNAPRRTPGFTVPAASVILSGETIADTVQVAIGAVDAAGVSLMIGWHTSDGVAFALARLDRATGAFALVGDVVRQPVAPPTSAEPGWRAPFSITHVAEGLSSMGPSHGGYVVAWSGTETFAARFGEDGARLAPGVVSLGVRLDLPRAVLVGARASEPVGPTMDGGADLDGGAPRVTPASTARVQLVGHDPSADRFVVVPSVCGRAGG